ncbi:LytTR family transcriptional regulator DNA-binding domain-containing protein [Photobacterium damselae subsp. damselae]|uniref:LytTR family transcriptional regulator DNA-binding domain-containing protein n=1 Tax=Photobacterium damselae subsp. damselae TaxID=85581 RepID=A0A850QYK4_PHODD|nr:LytTR family transcriptional regulator DNA-binding domain-containing protein [Photobacterium damselae subsp. damselae]
MKFKIIACGSFFYFCLIVLAFWAYTLTYGDLQREEKRSLDRLSFLFNHSTVVMDDLYVGTYDGLEHELTYLLNSVAFEHSLESMCGEVSANDGGDGIAYNIIRCSDDGVYSEILNKLPRTYDYQIKLGDITYGTLTWRVISNNNVFSLHYVPVHLFMALSTAIYLGFLWICLGPYGFKRKSEICESKEERDQYRNLIEQVGNTLNVINNSCNGVNKKHFPLNDDVVYVEYKAPYSTIHYFNGTNRMMRVSLLELENCIYNCFVRIKRNMLVNKNQLSNCAKMEVKGVNKSELVITIRGEKRKFNVTSATGYKVLIDKLHLRNG